jgi:hypothetical protein
MRGSTLFRIRWSNCIGINHKGGRFLVFQVGRSIFGYFHIYLYKSNFSLLHLLGTIAKVWNSWVSSKVIVFSWQALLGRLPTRENLVRRGVVLEGPIAGCVLCGEGRETEDHLFASCPTTWEVWAKVHRWFGMTSVVPSTIGSLF